MNLLIAIILFLMTAFALYASLRLARRSRRIDAVSNKQSGEEKPNEDVQQVKKRKEKWGVEKDAYCYPSINDVMGYEFVKVVKTGTTNEQALQEPVEPETRKPWEESQGIGGLRTVSSTDITSESEEDEFYPDPTQPARPRPRFPNMPDHEENAQKEEKITDQTETDNNYDDEDVTEIPGINEEDLELMQNMPEMFRDYEPPVDSIPDDGIDQLIDDNPEVVEEPVIDEEKVEMAKAVRNFREIYHKVEKESMVDEVKQLTENNDE